jgi:ubiquinone/menaquinone biosynthesis C-methylase UbiE
VTATDLATVRAEERRIMNLYAPVYDGAVKTNGYVYQIERAQFVEWIAKTLRDVGRNPRTESVLDVGCGTGSASELLAQAGFTSVTGMDLADGMLAQARKRLLDRARWVQATIEEPPFGRATFDVVLALFTIHHLYDPGAFFRLADRTLRPGGWFFVLEYDGDSGTFEGGGGTGGTRALGDLLRGWYARKNRRALAARPAIEPLFNPAHRALGFDEIRRMLPDPDAYRVHREHRGVVLPALLPVLVEESAIDRTVARLAGAIDRRLERRGGLFQWIAGRRR